MYGVVSLGYANNDIDTFETEGLSYKLGVGYELTEQWYVEGTFQGLGNEDSGTFPEFGSSTSDFYALSVSALGKARNQYGELFYRVGVAHVNAQVESVGQLVCEPNIVTPGLCEIDEGIIAGVIGLGFDFHVFRSAMVRFEVEYINGEQGYNANAAHIGVRLNF
jgi:hypothetical protein